MTFEELNAMRKELVPNLLCVSTGCISDKHANSHVE
jgi:hypothetical protein